MKRVVWFVGFILVVAIGVVGYLYAQSRGGAPKFRTAKVERGPLTAAVSATGNLNAVITVQVGSQVSGQIQKLFADFNSVVKRGQVIAQIDPELFQAQVNQAKADVEASRAAVLNQTATVEKARADVESARAAQAQGKAQSVKAGAAMADARRIHERNVELFRRNLIAAQDRDTAQANADQAVAQYEAAQANEQALGAAIQSAQAQFRVQEAALSAARATVQQKQAALKQAQINLDHTTISAPVDGVVVSRAVDVGQTVAASLQAPVLFTIAQDLTKMQVETSVDEADIGRIRESGPATFTVDAFAGQTFTGTITQIRKAALIVQNVVTYIVVVGVDNPGGRLLPGMTANVKLAYAEKPSVLKVPNAALRFRPPGEAPPVPGGAGGAGGGRGAGGGGGPGPAAPGGGAGGGQGRGGGNIRERLVSELKLTAVQQARLDPILEDARQQMRGLQGLPDQERQAQGQKIREASRQKIREILTAEQRGKYDQMTAAIADPRAASSAGRAFVLDAEGKPKALSLRLGISDGNATEVLSGELQEGQEVIIGLGGAKGSTGGATGAPRLRL